ncbi:hypothetical protein EAH87_05750 [Sphingomonas koreensis]|nr:hypothetical protein EAH87_05750 [Sphingomonas koreensis]
MIAFEQVWLPQIIDYARLIHSGQLENEWLGISDRATSVIDPDELHEQVFGDLDADGIWPPVRGIGRVSARMSDAIDRFLAALRDVDSNEPTVVIASVAGTRAKDAAGAVLANVG